MNKKFIISQSVNMKKSKIKDLTMMKMKMDIKMKYHRLILMVICMILKWKQIDQEVTFILLMINQVFKSIMIKDSKEGTPNLVDSNILLMKIILVNLETINYLIHLLICNLLIVMLVEQVYLKRKV